MARISKDEVMHLASLSNISLTDEEVASMQADLENILNYVSQLESIDTDGVEPTYQVNGLQNIDRADEIIDYGVTREQLLEVVPEKLDDQIKVPEVI
ncbi:MAG: Asp-tRNA(Asn)/Glu-tRNA(Gln) amidotransferase subunit GatC [Patescibacteria group bacterium]